MLDRLIKEFREAYLSLLQGSGTDEDRNRLVDLIMIIESFRGMENLMKAMDDVFTKTQKLQYQLVKNRIQLNAHAFYTEFGGFGFLIDTKAENDYGTRGSIITFNLSKVDVVVKKADLLVKLSDSIDYRLFYSGDIKDYFVHSFNSHEVSYGLSRKGSHNYLSIDRHFNGVRINHKAHVILFGMHIGYSSILTCGSNKVFVLNHLDENKWNNLKSNLELISQSENLKYSAEIAAMKTYTFFQNLNHELGLSVAL